jgi:pyruvate dehydrogenase E1 component
MTAFASLAQDYLAARGAVKPEKMGRMISLLGDAELDEGNIYEALIEACKHDIRNTWWIVDYNRQSLDATTQDRMFTRYGEIFEAAGWTVETLKWSRRQREAFARPGGLRAPGNGSRPRPTTFTRRSATKAAPLGANG